MPEVEPQEALAPLSIEEARTLFPGLERYTYFATNGQALLPQPTRDRMVASIDGLMKRGYAQASRLESEVDGVRAKVARLIGAEADEIAFVRNTGEGLCLVADSIDWKPGDEVLTFAGEYRSVVHAFQGLGHRGVEVRVVKPEEGCVTAELVERELRDCTRAVAMSWVRFDNGARADLERIGALLERAGRLFIVDGIQGVGVLPVDVRAARVSFLAAGAHKWLLGVSGTGVLYVRREVLRQLLPTHLGVGSMRDADAEHGMNDPYVVDLAPATRRFEEGARNALGIAALGESLDLALRLGIDNIAAHVKHVTDRLCDGFRDAGGRVLSPRHDGSWSGIFLLEPAPGVDVRDLWQRLLAERIILGVRDGALWGGAHYFTNLGDADRLLSQL